MSIAYFPGCTLSTKATGYDISGRAVAQALGMPLEELPEWQCCGATFPLATENSMALIAPTRLLAQVEKVGGKVTTLCAICFHVLRRSQNFLENHPEMLDRINWFTEEPYSGKATVTHFLEILRDELTWKGLSEKVNTPLKGLRVAPYYGCLLLRPPTEIKMDDPENPTILHECLTALGCDVVDFPYQSECCGSYLAVSKPDLPEKLAGEITASARRHGAQALVTACPLCQFNLDYPQRAKDQAWNGGQIPVLYFTQLMAVALGLETAVWGMENHYVDPRYLFESYQLSVGSDQLSDEN
ncbi:MAG: CoB--CoM heterodisulfide reductase iron-sulfur subunit B family protein [Anaerolineales bacterium]|nr:CoB--CoM heterodisulfide reductase iron-sulfur subunit B family protein [Anaerolineales bacterium]